MKAAWETAIFDAATVGMRFDHADNCHGVRCNCGAGVANIAMDEMAEGLKIGVPLEGVNLAELVITFMDDNALLLEGDPRANKLYRAAKAVIADQE